MPDSARPHSRWLWGWAALAILVTTLGWSLLSHQFLHGEGYSERPIWTFLALYGVAWAGLLLAVRLLHRTGGRGPLLFIMAVALLARVLLLPSNLIQENDVYRYLLDGQVLLGGGNPYAYTPGEIAGSETHRKELQLDRPEAQEVLKRIGYPGIRTVYPPLAQFVFSLGSRLGDWDWRGFRWIFLGLDLLCILALIDLLPRMGLAPAWVVLYAWNPLVLKEVTNSVHVDVLVCLMLLIAVSGFRITQAGRSGRWGIAIASLGMAGAIATKLYPIILLPSGFLFLLRTRGAVPGLGFLIVTIGLALAGYWPFAEVGLAVLGEGLWTYATLWRMNEGFYALLAALPYARGLCVMLVVTCSVVVPLMRRSETTTSLLESFLYVHLLWFLLIPSPFPWYALPLCALLPLTGGASRATPAVLALCGTVALYYFSFLYEYRGYPAHWWSLIRSLEHGVVWMCLLLSHWKGLTRRSA